MAEVLLRYGSARQQHKARGEDGLAGLGVSRCTHMGRKRRSTRLVWLQRQAQRLLSSRDDVFAGSRREKVLCNAHPLALVLELELELELSPAAGHVHSNPDSNHSIRVNHSRKTSWRRRINGGVAVGHNVSNHHPPALRVSSPLVFGRADLLPCISSFL